MWEAPKERSACQARSSTSAKERTGKRHDAALVVEAVQLRVNGDERTRTADACTAMDKDGAWQILVERLHL